MIRIAICDDEIGTCSEIEQMIGAFAKSRAIQTETEVFYSGETLYASLQARERFDLVFLDIQLLRLDGVAVGKQIREQLGDEMISIVYISSKESYAMRLFQVRPLDFLIKPLTQEKITAILEKYIRLHEAVKKEFLYKSGKSICKLYLDEIRYFSCSGKKFEIHTGTDVKTCYGAMKEIWRQVEGRGFWIIHKSYIVNHAFVSVYHYDSVEMTDGEVLPISQKYRRQMKENLAAQYRKR